MNHFQPADDRDPESVPGTPQIEALLLATRGPVPSADFRQRVLVAMEVAASDRHSILAAHRPTRPGSRSRVLPEAIAGAAASLCVLVLAWQDGGRAPAPAAPAVVDVAPGSSAEEPPDVHRALELLDARRELFAAVQAGTAEPRAPHDADVARLRGTL